MFKYFLSILPISFMLSCGTHKTEKKTTTDTIALAQQSQEKNVQIDTLQFVDFSLDKYFNIPSFIDKKGNFINLYTEESALNNDQLYGVIMQIMSRPDTFNIDDEGNKTVVHQKLISYKRLNVPSYMAYKPILTIIQDIENLPQVKQMPNATVYVTGGPNSKLNAYSLTVTFGDRNPYHEALFRVYQVGGYRIMHYDKEKDVETPVERWEGN